MNKTITQAEVALASANAAYLSELERDAERNGGSGTQERRREERQQTLRDDIECCERELKEVKHISDELANRLMKLHQVLEERRDMGTDWSLARALEDRVGSYQTVSDDFDNAERLLKKHGF